MRLLTFLALVLLCPALPAQKIPRAQKERHAVVIVWDGMRPDFVSESHTPALWKLARDGVTFRHHHASYLSATVVNSTAIATGCYPSGSGIFANYIFRPRHLPDQIRRRGRNFGRAQRRQHYRRKIYY